GGYERLLRRVKTLNRAHQLKIALGHASSMGCHLRFGFEVTYRRDTLLMRDDNAADYPWLCFALLALIREYDEKGARGFPPSGTTPSAGGRAFQAGVIEALANGLSADARAFVGAPSPSLSTATADRAEFRDLFLAHRAALLSEFERLRPVDGQYSP